MFGIGSDAQRVAVERLQSLDLAVVVELAPGEGILAQRVHAGDALVEEIEVRRLALRIEVPLDAIDVVLGGELALLALERRIVREVDAALEPHRPDFAIGRHLGQRRCGVRLRLRRSREKIVLERRIEDVRDDVARVEIVDLHRVEAGLGDEEGVAQHLLGRGGRRQQCAG